MGLNHIFEYEDHIRFRRVELGKVEVALIKERLAHPEGIVWFEPYLGVRENLPAELLQPTLLSGLRCKHVYFPSHWMPDLKWMSCLGRSLMRSVRKASPVMPMNFRHK